MDPCAAVRASCAGVVARATHVAIDDAALAAFADQLGAATRLRPPAWDDGGWHYAADAAEGGPRTAQYVLVLDALNWCFWPSATGLEYEHLARGLKRALEADPAAFDAGALAAATADTVRGWLAPHDVPNAEERAAKLRELGDGLAAGYGGSAAALVAAARGSAVALVRLLAATFPGFRDEAVHAGRHVFLYKRAQIAVGDLWAAYGRRTDAGSGGSPYAFADVGALTCFPDYRLPQLLRSAGVLVYAPPLAADVDARVALPPGCAAEVEIRAATVVAVERLTGALNAAIAARVAAGGGGAEDGGDGGEPPLRPLTAVELDWHLWQAGEAAAGAGALPPHHRVDTVFY
jgi:hypothetical protein